MQNPRPLVPTNLDHQNKNQYMFYLTALNKEFRLCRRLDLVSPPLEVPPTAFHSTFSICYISLRLALVSFNPCNPSSSLAKLAVKDDEEGRRQESLLQHCSVGKGYRRLRYTYRYAILGVRSGGGAQIPSNACV